MTCSVLRENNVNCSRLCSQCVLQKSESQRNGKQELLKAFERLGKVLPEEDICQLVGSMVQKNGADMKNRQSDCKMRQRKNKIARIKKKRL
ncbi:hypothetical protein LguiB_020550 [Lonicera macranthoides]